MLSPVRLFTLYLSLKSIKSSGKVLHPVPAFSNELTHRGARVGVAAKLGRRFNLVRSPLVVLFPAPRYSLATLDILCGQSSSSVAVGSTLQNNVF
ncbi:hypothetical protein EVAR_12858_1 [Eumeta japonica]|uniref:Uncharacterized protein n=1 Tax=Eumeta variegata TaxID=151549 RepID=A0A4C1TVQ3_EUMVA|nr:hypothetical protein EVAR_12858_1 [Eumeta japonica]